MAEERKLSKYSKLVLNEKNFMSKYIYANQQGNKEQRHQLKHMPAAPPPSPPSSASSFTSNSIDSDYSSSSSDSNLNDMGDDEADESMMQEATQTPTPTPTPQTQPSPLPQPLAQQQLQPQQQQSSQHPPCSFVADSLSMQFVKVRNDSTTTTTTTAKSVISTASGSAPSPRVSSPSAFKYYTHFLNSIPHFSELKPVVSQSSSTAHHHHHHNHHHRSSSRNRDRGTASNQAASTPVSASTPVYSNGNTSLQNKQFNKSNDSNVSSSSSSRKQQPIQSYKPNPLYGRLNSSNASKESLDLKKTPGSCESSGGMSSPCPHTGLCKKPPISPTSILRLHRNSASGVAAADSMSNMNKTPPAKRIDRLCREFHELAQKGDELKKKDQIIRENYRNLRSRLYSNESSNSNHRPPNRPCHVVHLATSSSCSSTSAAASAKQLLKAQPTPANTTESSCQNSQNVSFTSTQSSSASSTPTHTTSFTSSNSSFKKPLRHSRSSVSTTSTYTSGSSSSSSSSSSANSSRCFFPGRSSQRQAKAKSKHHSSSLNGKKSDPINIYIEITPQEQHDLIHHKIPSAALHAHRHHHHHHPHLHHNLASCLAYHSSPSLQKFPQRHQCEHYQNENAQYSIGASKKSSEDKGKETEYDQPMYYNRDLNSNQLYEQQQRQLQEQQQQQQQEQYASSSSSSSSTRKSYQHSYSMVEKSNYSHQRSSSVDRKRLKFIYGQETPAINALTRTGSISTVPFANNSAIINGSQNAQQLQQQQNQNYDYQQQYQSQQRDQYTSQEQQEQLYQQQLKLQLQQQKQQQLYQQQQQQLKQQQQQQQQLQQQEKQRQQQYQTYQNNYYDQQLKQQQQQNQNFTSSSNYLTSDSSLYNYKQQQQPQKQATSDVQYITTNQPLIYDGVQQIYTQQQLDEERLKQKRQADYEAKQREFIEQQLQAKQQQQQPKQQQPEYQNDYQYNLEKQYKIVDQLVESRQQKQKQQQQQQQQTAEYSPYDYTVVPNPQQFTNGSQYAMPQYKLASTNPSSSSINKSLINGNARNSQNRVKFNDIIQVFEHKGNEEIFTGVPVQPTYHQTTCVDANAAAAAAANSIASVISAATSGSNGTTVNGLVRKFDQPTTNSINSIPTTVLSPLAPKQPASLSTQHIQFNNIQSSQSLNGPSLKPQQPAIRVPVVADLVTTYIPEPVIYTNDNASSLASSSSTSSRSTLQNNQTQQESMSATSAAASTFYSKKFNSSSDQLSSNSILEGFDSVNSSLQQPQSQPQYQPARLPPQYQSSSSSDYYQQKSSSGYAGSSTAGASSSVERPVPIIITSSSSERSSTSINNSRPVRIQVPVMTSTPVEFSSLDSFSNTVHSGTGLGMDCDQLTSLLSSTSDSFSTPQRKFIEIKADDGNFNSNINSSSSLSSSSSYKMQQQQQQESSSRQYYENSQQYSASNKSSNERIVPIEYHRTSDFVMNGNDLLPSLASSSNSRFGRRSSRLAGDETNVGELNDIFQKMYMRHRNSVVAASSSSELEHHHSSSSMAANAAAANSRRYSYSSSNNRIN